MQIQDLNYAGSPWVQHMESVATVLAIMENEQLGHIPVVEGDTYLGLVSKEALFEVMDDSTTLQQLAWSLPRPFVKPADHFLAAIQLMDEQGLTLVPIITDQQELIAAISVQELLTAVGKFLGLQEGGALLVLEKEAQHYTASEVAKLVESNDAQLEHLNTIINAQTGIIQLTIRLNKYEVSDIIATFQRYDYTVLYYVGEEQYANELKSNYDHLIHYLKI
ncbi:MAG: CBS domain-containing protein [Bacteroidetes bacterium]|nr:CBS domain-containing protein [Bacteroidota bacterium]